MHLICVGLSHQTASVALREKLAMNEAAAAQTLRELKALYPNAEMTLLSTCNRTELYVARPLHGHPRIDSVLSYFADSRNLPADELATAAYHHDNEKAIRHLFRVSSGLDSMVLGENQIIGQVRAAYELAKQEQAVGKVLHKVFQSALATGKRVRTQTLLGAGRRSVSSVAVDFARHLYYRFDDKTVLVIGAGKMTDLTLAQFMALKPEKLIVCNRTIERALPLAAKYGGEARPFEQLDEALIEADVVITSTGATEPIVTAERFKPLIKKRRFRPLFVIDMAVPRDFSEAVGELANVYLYNMDDLQRALADDHAARSEQISAAEAILEPIVMECYTAVQQNDFADLIRKLRDQLHEIGQAESGRTVNKLRGADPSMLQPIIEEHTHRVVNKILHRPISELGRGRSDAAAMYATALRRLFELDDEEDMDQPERTEPR
ncbi:glutamyl-tRNA reductase [Planctomycetales bacterium ZRK34]|nr:glutamyl-tRNA reductase [Planctomycetales bacterium ZRK34]